MEEIYHRASVPRFRHTGSILVLEHRGLIPKSCAIEEGSTPRLKFPGFPAWSDLLVMSLCA
jgi:hypothetical protein